MGRRCSWLAGLALAACFPLGTVAQDVTVLPEIRVTSRPYTPHTLQFAAQSNLIQARVVVRDAHGNPIPGLLRQDFRMLVDGKPVAFTGFSMESVPAAAASAAATPARTTRGLPRLPAPQAATPRPRFVALFVDDLSLDTNGIMLARDAARKLKAADLAGNVQVGIFTSSGTVALNFTADSAAWDQAAEKLQLHSQMPPKGIIPRANFSSEFAYSVAQDTSDSSPYTQLAEGIMAAAGLCISHDACHDTAIDEAHATVHAAEAASMDILSSMQDAIAALASKDGDRILILTSTGFFANTLKPRMAEVTNQALHDNVVIDGLDLRALEPDQPTDSPLEHMVATNERLALNQPMADLADSTGGIFLQDTNDLTGALGHLAAEPEIAYALSFAPQSLPHDGKYHSIKVEALNVSHAEVRTRKGYFDPLPEDDLYRAVTSAAVDAAVLGPPRTSAISVNVATAWSKGDLRVDVRLNPATLHYVGCDSARRCENLVFTSAVFDPNGRFVTGKTGALGLELTHAGYSHLVKSGLGANLSLKVPAGVYRIREVIQEGIGGNVVAFDQVIHPGT